MATKPAKSVGKVKRPDSKKRKPSFTADDAWELKKQAKRKGLKSGSRNSQPSADELRAPKAPKDSRIGSRKPIELKAPEAVVVPKPEKPAAPKKVPLTPEQQQAKWQHELDQLEDDPRLSALLDKVELEQTLRPADQEWLDKTLARYDKLLSLLGLDQDDDGDVDAEDELLNRFMDSHFNPHDFDDDDGSSSKA